LLENVTRREHFDSRPSGYAVWWVGNRRSDAHPIVFKDRAGSVTDVHPGEFRGAVILAFAFGDLEIVNTSDTGAH